MSASSLIQELGTTSILSRRKDRSSLRALLLPSCCLRESVIFRFLHASWSARGGHFPGVCYGPKAQDGSRDVFLHRRLRGSGRDRGNSLLPSATGLPTFWKSTDKQRSELWFASERHGGSSWMERKRKGRRGVTGKRATDVASAGLSLTIKGLEEYGSLVRLCDGRAIGVSKGQPSRSRLQSPLLSSLRPLFSFQVGTLNGIPAPWSNVAVTEAAAMADTLAQAADVAAMTKTDEDEETTVVPLTRRQHHPNPNRPGCLSGLANVDPSSWDPKQLARVFRRLQRSGGLSESCVSLADLRCLLLSCCRRKLVEDACAVLNGMEDLFLGSVPVGCYKAVIEGYGTVGRLGDMETVFARGMENCCSLGMRRGLYESMIVGYCAAGRVEQGLSVFREGKEVVGSLDARAYGMLIKACGKRVGYESEAERLFWEMRSIMLNDNNQRRETKGGSVRESESSSSSVREERQARVVAAAYSNGLQALTRNGNARKAWKVFDRDTHRRGGGGGGGRLSFGGVLPSGYEASARACAAMGWTETGIDMLKEMKWVAMQVKGEGRGGEWGEVEMEFSPSAYAALIDLYIAGGRYADVVQTVQQMKKKGVPPTCALTNTLVRACAEGRGQWVGRLVRLLRRSSWEKCRIACMLLFPSRQARSLQSNGSAVRKREKEDNVMGARENLGHVSRAQQMPQATDHWPELEEEHFPFTVTTSEKYVEREEEGHMVAAGVPGLKGRDGGLALRVPMRSSGIDGYVDGKQRRAAQGLEQRDFEDGFTDGEDKEEKEEGGGDDSDYVWSRLGRVFAKQAREESYTENASFCNTLVDALLYRGMVGRAQEVIKAARKTWPSYGKIKWGTRAANWSLDCRGLSAGAARLVLLDWLEELAIRTSHSALQLDREGGERGRSCLLPLDVKVIVGHPVGKQGDDDDGDGGAREGGSVWVGLEGSGRVSSPSSLTGVERREQKFPKVGNVPSWSGVSILAGEGGKEEISTKGGSPARINHMEIPEQQQQGWNQQRPCFPLSNGRGGLGKGAVRKSVMEVLTALNSPFSQSREDDSVLVAGASSMKNWLSSVNMPITERWLGCQQNFLDQRAAVRRNGVAKPFRPKKVAVIPAKGKSRRMLSREEEEEVVNYREETVNTWRL
ncbi:hypothetical protein CBR_g2745 [Chara braunii]|uniref:Smr domain-containing protein n=1 Tax=Chara braunii TaxID=69332 RepID=A0A388KE24_CHABU|nr:hypothetical protein CBR_g2745 [Chara braunii]|eukprot:GBG68193.1 hypothetical protein CBR_g2745 [Chara braunii]